MLSNHADAIPLPKAAKEVFLRPRGTKATLLNAQHFGHIPADHPTNVHAKRPVQFANITLTKAFALPNLGSGPFAWLVTQPFPKTPTRLVACRIIHLFHPKSPEEFT
jgi:hypothetical protein